MALSPSARHRGRPPLHDACPFCTPRREGRTVASGRPPPRPLRCPPRGPAANTQFYCGNACAPADPARRWGPEGGPEPPAVRQQACFHVIAAQNRRARPCRGTGAPCTGRARAPPRETAPGSRLGPGLPGGRWRRARPRDGKQLPPCRTAGAAEADPEARSPDSQSSAPPSTACSSRHP